MARATWKHLVIGVALVGVVVAGLMVGSSRLERSVAGERADRVRGDGRLAARVASTMTTSNVLQLPEGTLTEPASASASASALSPYQAEVAGPTLQVLDDMERNARTRGETMLLARVQTERARVLRAAAGLPRIPTTAQKERNAQ